MHDMTAEEIRRRKRKRGFGYIAFWQLLTLVLFVCLIWVNETFDLPGLFFGAYADESGFYRGWILTATAFVIAVILIGNTYLQQKKIIRGVIVLCMRCGKVKVEHEVWEELQRYVIDRTDALPTHGLCPECFEKDMAKFDEMERNNVQSVSRTCRWWDSSDTE